MALTMEEEKKRAILNFLPGMVPAIHTTQEFGGEERIVTKAYCISPHTTVGMGRKNRGKMLLP